MSFSSEYSSHAHYSKALFSKSWLKAMSCSHGQREPEWMCISCVHMNPHKIDAHLIHIWLKPPPEVVWMRIQAGYTYNETVCLLNGLACGACYIASLCSALAVTLEKKAACFLWPRRVAQHGKIIIMMALLWCKCEKPHCKYWTQFHYAPFCPHDIRVNYSSKV